MSCEYMICDWRDEGEIHIVPTDAEHGRAECWCQPETEQVNDIVIYDHFAKQ